MKPDDQTALATGRNKVRKRESFSPMPSRRNASTSSHSEKGGKAQALTFVVSSAGPPTSAMASRRSSRWIQSVVAPDLPRDGMSDLKESTLASRAREGAREGAVTTREKSGQLCSARSSPRWQVKIASMLRKAPGAAWRRERQETEGQENGDRKISILKDRGFSGRGFSGR